LFFLLAVALSAPNGVLAQQQASVAGGKKGGDANLADPAQLPAKQVQPPKADRAAKAKAERAEVKAKKTEVRAEKAEARAERAEVKAERAKAKAEKPAKAEEPWAHNPKRAPTKGPSDYKSSHGGYRGGTADAGY
jgi:hypothetical protein